LIAGNHHPGGFLFGWCGARIGIHVADYRVTLNYGSTRNLTVLIEGCSKLEKRDFCPARVSMNLKNLLLLLLLLLWPFLVIGVTFTVKDVDVDHFQTHAIPLN
jgi:hypothetical protein